MTVFIVTRSNYYPETRAQDEALWTQIESVHSTRDTAEARIVELKALLEVENRTMYEDPDYTLANDADADVFDITEREVL